MLKIYGRANALNVRKVLWLADELGLSYEQENWGRGYRSTTEPQFAKLSPFGRVPILDDDGRIVRESQAILRYLCRRTNRTDLHPTACIEAAAAAEVDAWMDWAATDLYNGSRPVFLALVMKQRGYQDARILETAIVDWTREMRILDRHLATKPSYLAHDRFTLADVSVGLIVHRWFSIDFPKPDLPAVAAYYGVLSERPAYLRNVRNGIP